MAGTATAAEVGALAGRLGSLDVDPTAEPPPALTPGIPACSLAPHVLELVLCRLDW